MITINSLLIEAMDKHGSDGFVNFDLNCFCLRDNLQACGGSKPTCLLARKVERDGQEFMAATGSSDTRELRLSFTSDLAESARKIAVRYVTDQKELEEIALNDKSVAVQYAAVERLEDQRALTKVVLANSFSKRELWMAAIQRITDQNLLGRIATTHYDSEICIAAIQMIEDQHILAYIVLAIDDTDINATAVARITDQHILATLVRFAGWDKGEIALSRLTDLDLLSDLVDDTFARTDHDLIVRRFNEVYAEAS